MMDKHGEWRLAPAFDICYSYRPGSIWVSKQSLTVNGKRENFTKNDLLEVAQKMNIKRAEHIISEIQQAVNLWPVYAERAGVKEDLKKVIASNLLKL